METICLRKVNTYPEWFVERIRRVAVVYRDVTIHTPRPKIKERRVGREVGLQHKRLYNEWKIKRMWIIILLSFAWHLLKSKGQTKHKANKLSNRLRGCYF